MGANRNLRDVLVLQWSLDGGTKAFKWIEKHIIYFTRLNELVQHYISDGSHNHEIIELLQEPYSLKKQTQAMVNDVHP